MPKMGIFFRIVTAAAHFNAQFYWHYFLTLQEVNQNMQASLQYLKDQLPLCRNGIVKTVQAQDEAMERCMVEFVRWKNYSTMSCSASLENDLPAHTLLLSGAAIPVTLKFINRRKNLYMMVKGIFTINNCVSPDKQNAAMAEICIDKVDYFTMRQYGDSIRVLELKIA